KYQTVWGNQFAIFQQQQGGDAVAQVLTSAHPEGGQLNSWKWDYPAGAGDYYALYPKSWYDYRWDKFPAHVTLEQFSPVLPDNYKETSYPVAVYRWHAENPTKKKITVSVLLSWTNMLGWMRGYGRDFRAGLNEGNFDRFNSEHLGSEMTKGVMFERNRCGKELNAWDGQMTIAALQSSWVAVTYVTTYSPKGDGSEVWNSFAKDGNISNTEAQWLSRCKMLGDEIAVTMSIV